MALGPDAVGNRDGGQHRRKITAAVVGEYLFEVSRGRRYVINVGNPGAAVFDVIFYNFSAQDDVSDGLTRVKGVAASAISDLLYNKASIAGLAEFGIEITNIGAGSDVHLEVVEWKN